MEEAVIALAGAWMTEWAQVATVLSGGAAKKCMEHLACYSMGLR